MGTPIYILAGQSNATAMRDEFTAALQRNVAGGDYHSAMVAEGGAPLTRQRSGDDWATNGELRTQLYQTIKGFLDKDPDAYLGGVIWAQGEADTYDLGHPEDYNLLLQELFEEVGNTLKDDFPARDVLGDGGNLVISGLSVQAAEAPLRDNWQTIRNQQMALAAGSEEIRIVDPDKIAQLNDVSADNMFRDGLHYSTEFQRLQMDALVGVMLANDGVTSQVIPHQGTGGADRFVGTSGDDTYLINHRDDTVLELSGQGFDTVVSDRFIFLNRLGPHIEAVVLTGDRNTMAFGNKRENVMAGNAGDNVLKGYSNDDTLRGNDGNDRLFGGSGNDVLIGGTGWDQFTGGGGRDVFVFAGADIRWKERVMDYDDQLDILRIEINGKSFEDLTIFQEGNGLGTVVNYGPGSFLLMGIEKSALDATDFEFI